jgi:class I fructose-bisphosphate aldolase
VRREAERAGLPLIMWAYPRGKFLEAKGGRDSLYAVDYAARVAQELGADVVKVNYPKMDEAKSALYPKEYQDPKILKWSKLQMLEQVVSSAGRTLVIMSGGSKRTDEQLTDDVKTALDAGAAGFIFGRNVWQRRFGEALELVGKITKLTQSSGRPVPGKTALV